MYLNLITKNKLYDTYNDLRNCLVQGYFSNLTNQNVREQISLIFFSKE